MVILDDNALDSPTLGKEDTLFRAKYISATFSLNGLLSKDGIKLKSAKVTDALFVLTSEPVDDPNLKGTSNLKRIMNLGSSSKASESSEDSEATDTSVEEDAPSEEAEKKGSGTIRIANVEVNGMAFRLKNYKTPKKPASPVADAINWRDLDISDIRLKGHNLCIDGGVISGNVDRLSFNEKSGFSASNLSGKVSVGNGHTEIKDLRISDENSDLNLSEFHLRYDDSKSFNDFINNVRIDAEIEDSEVSFETIAYFAKALKKMSFDANVHGGFHGYVSDFELDRLSFSNVHDGMYGTIDGRLAGLPDSGEMVLNASLSDMSFTLEEIGNFITGFAPSAKIDLSNFAKGRRFSFEGSAKGPVNGLEIDGRGTSEIGDFHAELNLGNVLDAGSPIQISGNLNTSELNLGEIIGSEELGECTMVTRLGAVLEKGSPRISVDTLAIGKLRAHGYTYKGIYGRGKYGKDGFEGNIVSNDPNLTLVANASSTSSSEDRDGDMQIRLDLQRADLDTLNLYNNGTSILRFSADAFLDSYRDGSTKGEASIDNVILQDVNGIHNIGNILVTAATKESSHSISINSSVIEGNFTGSGPIGSFVKDFTNLSLKKEIPAVFGEAGEEWTGNSYDVNLSIHDSHDLLAFFVPGLYVAGSTQVKAGIDGDGLLSGRVQSQRLAFKKRYIKDVTIDFNNSEDALNVEILSDEISASPIFTKGNRITALAHGNSIGLGFSYDNQTELANKGEIFLDCDLERMEDNSLGAFARILKSGIYLNSAAWTINPAEIDFENGHIKARDFLLNSDIQSISIEGGYSKSISYTLEVKLNQFDISSLNPFFGESISFGGTATGTAIVISPVSQSGGLAAGIAVEGTEISGRPAGTIYLGSKWNDEKKGFDVSLRNVKDEAMALQADAVYIPSSKTINGTVGFDKFDLGYAGQILESLFSEFSGNLSGKISLSGPADKMDIESTDLRIDDGLMRVDFTNVAYQVDGPLHLDNEGAWFDSITLKDKFDETGQISGGISWNRFKDISLGTNISFSNMEVLDIP